VTVKYIARVSLKGAVDGFHSSGSLTVWGWFSFYRIGFRWFPRDKMDWFFGYWFLVVFPRNWTGSVGFG
jgi:hypothetical protein